LRRIGDQDDKKNVSQSHRTGIAAKAKPEEEEQEPVNEAPSNK
jgi:hypothetical protein